MAYQKSDYVLEKMQKTRELLISSGRKIVHTGGWKDCTVTAVTQNAGLSTGTLYTYFKDITELNMVIYQQIGDEELAFLTQIVNTKASASVRFMDVVTIYVGRALRGRVKAYAQIAEPLNPKMEQLKTRYQNKFIDCFEQIIRDGIEAAEFPPQQPEITATILFGGIKMTLMKYLEPGIRDQITDPHHLTSEILQVCLRIIGHTNSIKKRKESTERWA